MTRIVVSAIRLSVTLWMAGSAARCCRTPASDENVVPLGLLPPPGGPPLGVTTSGVLCAECRAGGTAAVSNDKYGGVRAVAASAIIVGVVPRCAIK